MYTDKLEKFFIASCNEHSRIIKQLDKAMDTKYIVKWNRFKKKWIQQSSGKTAKQKLEGIFGGNVQSNSSNKDAKKGKPDSMIWELGATIRQWKDAIKRNYELAGLGKVVGKGVSWTDCPYREICNNHIMTAAEINMARTKYPAFHDQETKYRTTAIEHLFCNVFKYSYCPQGRSNKTVTGYPHIVRHGNRTSHHLFPGPHSSNYNYLHWALYVLLMYIIYCLLLCFIIVYFCILYI